MGVSEAELIGNCNIQEKHYGNIRETVHRFTGIIGL